ncbi:MAG: tyrosine-type recombinase/integrase [Chloroflexi bacterium]|nr:tyrosine-type recombinase/integrase [Chloroflexota bacterium]
MDTDNALHIILTTERSPAAVYLASLTSAGSRRVMSQALRCVAALLLRQSAENPSIPSIDEAQLLTFAWGALRYPHVAAVRARLLEHYTPASVNRMLSALRGVLREAWRLGLMSAEDYARACDVQSVKGETLPAGRELSPGELYALVNVCKADHSAAGVRDAAMIGVLYTCGLRRAELVALDSGDFEPQNGRLSVRAGKGRKARSVFAQGGAQRALVEWLTLRSALRQQTPALFVPVLKGGHLAARRLHAQTVYDMLKRRAAQAGISAFSPHDMRRTFVGDMLERGVDIATVANIAGHASVDTTRRYDRRPEDSKRRAAEKLHFPY